jgi:hypothetical protein
MFFPLRHKGNNRAIKTPAYTIRPVPPQYPESLYLGCKTTRFRHEPRQGFYKQFIGFVRVYPVVFVHYAALFHPEDYAPLFIFVNR